MRRMRPDAAQDVRPVEDETRAGGVANYKTKSRSLLMHTLFFWPATRQLSTWRTRLRPDNIARAVSSGVWKRARSLTSPFSVLSAETALAGISYALALFLLAQDRGLTWALHVFRSTALWALFFRLAATVGARLYRRSLRHAGPRDLFVIVGAVLMSGILLCVFVSWRFSFLRVPRAVFLVDASFLQLFWTVLHFGAPLWRIQQASRRKHARRAIVVGAGDAGIRILKELTLDPESPSLPVALVDDDRKKWGSSLCGVPVRGGTASLASIAAETKADEILICIPSATHAQMHAILEASRRSDLPVRSLPSFAELLRAVPDGKVSRRDLHSPRIENLLQREEVRVDPSETRQVVGGRCVLVTGAGGSIGAELCSQIAEAGPRKLLLLDKAENSLFYVHLETSERLGRTSVKPFLVDLLDRNRVREIVRVERPEIVFHAAAHKHVAMLERHPLEGIRNNVFGTRDIAEAALECGVGRFINISTDKAVAPVNYMGLSKKFTELYIQELARSSATVSRFAPLTRFSSVRFGNVAGSTGSVLRIFWDQIRKGGPVRVTDPRATRFFMSISEAVHLIFRAAALGQGGETFVLDMGQPLNIYELARTVILFAGRKPGADIAIEFTGLTEGEKLSESLWEDWERPAPTESSRILAITGVRARSSGILAKIAGMEQIVERGDTEELLDYLQEMFPEFPRRRTSTGCEPVRRAAELTPIGAA